MAKNAGKDKKPRRALHIGVLVLGIYILFLGVGTLIGEVGALVILGEREAIVFIRIVMGLVFTGLGIYAVWDSIRDLWPKKEEEPPLQFIFTDAAGNRSSNVTPELIREQISRSAEDGQHISLQPVTPLPAGELGELVRLDHALFMTEEEPWVMIAVLRLDGGVHLRQKKADAAEAEAALTALLAGNVPDLSGWARRDIIPQPRELHPKQRLLLTRDNGTSDHEFFNERDLDLAVTGLTDGSYQRVIVQNGPVFIEAVPRVDGDVYLHLQFRGPEGARAWQRSGTPNQVRFWLVQFYDGSLFRAPLEGWDSAKPR